MTNIDFIIFYEHVPREWNSVQRLKRELNKLGLKGVVYPKHFYKYKTLVKFRPSIVIVPYLYSKKNDQHIMFEEIYGATPVLNLHSEQLHDETTKAFQMPHDDYASSAYHISWGNKFADALIDYGVKPKLIFKTGSIRNDDTFFKGKSRKEKGRILIPTAFSKTFVSSVYIDKLTSLDTIDKEKYLTKLRYTKEVRDAFFENIYKLSKKLPLKKFVFRPHPYVELNDYVDCFCKVNNISALPGNVYVERNGSIQDDVANSEKIITWYSSTALDAFLMDRNVIVYEPVSTPDYMKIDFLNYFKSASTIQELEDYVLESRDDTSSKETHEFISSVYGPVDGKSCQRVACVTYDILSNLSKREEKLHFFSYFKYYAKYLYIDIPKNIVRKLGVLDKIKPFYKGVTNDCLVNDTLDIEVCERNETALKISEHNNGYHVGD
ncbi:hypothetical protein VCHA57P527_90038 [Vibrio chagasii]|uniref:hypothetical protein n=1 Tax=Vibrio chagasii TaxID=170679 RepID=UPI00336DBFBC|nr:hypothetical protein VCHA57P527_90038 [Vibrio chagasii]